MRHGKYDCADGFCGAEDCTRCRPYLLPAEKEIYDNEQTEETNNTRNSGSHIALGHKPKQRRFVNLNGEHENAMAIIKR